MVDYYIGTMGFSYKDWAGSFYPAGVPAREYLTHYSRIFNTVEIDSTFYGIPKQGSVIRWRDQSPEGFKICLKVPRSITHESGLVDATREMQDFLRAISPLDEKLGVVLLQFPPSYDVSHSKVFEDFILDLPRDHTFAVEFRHPSWYNWKTKEMLARQDICWTATEYPGVPREVDLTSEIIFIRLVGQHGRFPVHNREQINVLPLLEKWWQWIRSNSDRVHSIYIFFNDDYSGHAPTSANRLKELIGLEIVKPNIPKQMRFL